MATKAPFDSAPTASGLRSGQAPTQRECRNQGQGLVVDCGTVEGAGLGGAGVIVHHTDDDGGGGDGFEVVDAEGIGAGGGFDDGTGGGVVRIGEGGGPVHGDGGGAGSGDGAGGDAAVLEAATVGVDAADEFNRSAGLGELQAVGGRVGE